MKLPWSSLFSGDNIILYPILPSNLSNNYYIILPLTIGNMFCFFLLKTNKGLHFIIRSCNNFFCNPYFYLLSCNNSFVVVVICVFFHNKSNKNSDEHKLLSLRWKTFSIAITNWMHLWIRCNLNCWMCMLHSLHGSRSLKWEGPLLLQILPLWYHESYICNSILVSKKITTRPKDLQ